MAKAEKPEKKDAIVHVQSGAELRAWRKAVGLRTSEMAERLGVGERSVIRAEAAAVPSARVLQGIHVLEDRLLAGELDINPLIRQRSKRGRPKTAGQPSGKPTRK